MSAKILTCKTYEMCDQTELAGSVISETVWSVGPGCWLQVNKVIKRRRDVPGHEGTKHGQGEAQDTYKFYAFTFPSNRIVWIKKYNKIQAEKVIIHVRYCHMKR